MRVTLDRHAVEALITALLSDNWIISSRRYAAKQLRRCIEEAARYDTSANRCRVCGCTDDNCFGCWKAAGRPCHWVADDLCSRCRDTALGRALLRDKGCR